MELWLMELWLMELWPMKVRRQRLASALRAVFAARRLPQLGFPSRMLRERWPVLWPAGPLFPIELRPRLESRSLHVWLAVRHDLLLWQGPQREPSQPWEPQAELLAEHLSELLTELPK